MCLFSGYLGEASVTPEESARMEELVCKIAVEKNQTVFLQLVTELNELLSHKSQRLSQAQEQPKPKRQ